MYTWVDIVISFLIGLLTAGAALLVTAVAGIIHWFA